MSKIKSNMKKRPLTINQEENRKKMFVNADESTRSDTILSRCSLCHRRFAPDRLRFHENACRKSIEKRRYRYDSKFYRRKGLKNNGENVNRSKSMKTNWKQRHEQFQNLIQGKTTIDNDDRLYSCSNCQRNFAREIGLTKHQKNCRTKSKK